MKSKRQEEILRIIEEVDVETQDQLLEQLRLRGVTSTQATISRDIKELRLVKVNDSRSGPRYVVAHAAEQDLSERQIRIFVDSVLSIQYNQSMVILKTISGSANAAAVPTAWPIIAAVAITRVALSAMWVVDACRPAKKRLSTFTE